MKTKTSHPSLVIAALAAFAFFALLATPAFSADISWNNTDTNFNANSSWSGGTAPGTSDRAIFSGTATSQPAVTTSTTVKSLTFDNTGSGAGYTLSGTVGKKLTLTSTTSDQNAAIFITNTTGTNTISTDLYFGNTSGTIYSVQSNASTLVLSGNISSALGGAGFRMPQVAGAVTTLSGSNSYVGNTTVVGGTLNINNARAISTGDLVLGNNTTIDNTSGGSLTLQNNNISLSGGTIAFTGSHDLNFGTGVMTVNNTNRYLAVNGGTLTVGSLDASATNLTFSKSGAGTLAISGAAGANLQGDFNLNGGTLLIGHKDSLGTGVLTIGANSTLAASTDLSGANAVTNNITMGNTLVLGGTHNLTLSGAITSSGAANRYLYANNTAGTIKLTGPIYLSETNTIGRTLILGGSNNMTISGDIANYNGVSGTAGNLSISSYRARVVSLTGTNSSYTGVTTLAGGGTVLEVAKLANGGQNSSIGASTSAKENLILPTSAKLRYIGTGDSTDRLFTLNGTGANNAFTLEASGSGAIQFTNTGSLGYGTNNQTRWLYLGGTNTGHNVLAAKIENNGTGATAVVKEGTGTWALTGENNTYTGTTTVTEGTLLIEGVQTGTGGVMVQNGAAIGGGGTIAGTLSFASGANIVFSLNGPSLIVNGSSIYFTAFGITNVLGLNGSVADGTYTLLDGSATFNTNNVSNWGYDNMVSIGGGKSAYFESGSLDVVVVPEPTTVGLIGLGGILTLALALRRRRS